MSGFTSKIGLIVGGVLVLGGAVFAFTYDPDTTPEEPPPPVRPAKTEVVATTGEVVKRAFPAVVRAQDEVDLSFRVSGPLIELPVKAGDEVIKDQLIAQIDPRDFRTQLARVTSSLDQARATLVKLKAGEREETIRILENQLSASQAERDNAAKEVERNKPLADNGRISKSQFDQIKLALQIADDRLEAAKQDLARAKAGAREEDILAQEAAIRGLEADQRAAQDAVDDTSLKAPFAGVIAKRFVENFQEVRVKSPIVSLQSVNRVRVVADIPEAVAATVKRTDLEKVTVKFEVEGTPEFDAEIEEVEIEADARTQTYAVTLSLERPEGFNVLPGMSASVRIYLKPEVLERQSGIAVAADAIFVDEAGTPFVWIVDPGSMTVSKKQIEVTDMSGPQVYVRSGISGGERIVTAGVHFLEDGMKIRLLDGQK